MTEIIIVGCAYAPARHGVSPVMDHEQSIICIFLYEEIER